jgi:ABC-type multidrug transport system fused ATPase/permease subunit
MRQGLEESETISTRETLRLFAEGLRYVWPFRVRFAVKAALTLLSLTPLLLLPWPIKVLIDHVIGGIPLRAELPAYPFFLRPLLAPLVDASTTEILLWTVAFQAFLVAIVGAFGTTGRERDQTGAYLEGGHDTATRTENQANYGHSFAGGLLGLFEFRWTLRLTQALNHHYRSLLFERIQSLPMPAFDDERIGDAVYRVMYDTPSITNTCYRILLAPTVAPVGILLTTAMLWFVVGEHPMVVWTGLAFLPGALLVTYPFAAMIRRRGVRSRQAGAVTTSTMEEGITNILAVQSLGGHDRQRQRFEQDSWISFGRYRGLALVAILAAFAALVPGLLVVRWAFLQVGELVISGALSLGDFTVVFSYFMQILFYAAELGSLWILLQESAPGLHRVFFLMALPGEQDPPAAQPLPRTRTTVQIEGVDFAYDAGALALRDVDLEFRVGELAALVGPAGAGKTTLAYLVPRFVSPLRGRVTADGIDIAGVRRDSLRSQVAFVFQETVLFDGTVEENIRIGNLAATEADVRRAAISAGADEFIRGFPQGYATRLGRAGAKLSVGQKQRLAIARALVRDTPILILDEPTSALDPETERRLVDSLREAARTRLVLVIAHRLSTVRHADQIVFLDSGRVVERGTHDELMANPGGAYRRFVDLQTRGAA